MRKWETEVNFLFSLMVSGRVVWAWIQVIRWEIFFNWVLVLFLPFIAFLTDHPESSHPGDLRATKGPSAENIQADIFLHQHFLVIRKIKMLYCFIQGRREEENCFFPPAVFGWGKLEPRALVLTQRTFPDDCFIQTSRTARHRHRLHLL